MQRRPSATEVSITLRDAPIPLSELRRALPRLTAELRKTYPAVRDVRIEAPLPIPRRKDGSYYAKEVHFATFVHPAHIELVIRLGYGILGGAGSEIGKAATKKIKQYVQQWLRKLDKPKRARKKPRSTKGAIH